MSREKQIDEMAKTLCEDCAKSDPCSLAAVGGMCNSVRKQATAMHNAGYRKQGEPISCGHEKGDKWISVEERLPEEGTRVLGYDYMGNVVCYFVYGTRYWFEDGWSSAKGWGVTHWMPLPEPPKGV